MQNVLNIQLLCRVKIGLIVSCSFISFFIVIDQLWFLFRSLPTSPIKNEFSTPALTLKPLAEYQEPFISRNLFAISLPNNSGPLSITSLADTLKDYRLKGIADFGALEALIVDARTGKAVFIKNGSELNGITVQRVARNSVRFRANGETFVMRLGEEGDWK